jgi:hypothetical protein
MLRADWKAHPAAGSVRSGLVRELTVEDKQFGALLVAGNTEICSCIPAFEQHAVREPRLLVERLAGDAWYRAWLPGQLMGIDDDVIALASLKLP